MRAVSKAALGERSETVEGDAVRLKREEIYDLRVESGTGAIVWNLSVPRNVEISAGVTFARHSLECSPAPFQLCEKVYAWYF